MQHDIQVVVPAATRLKILSSACPRIPQSRAVSLFWPQSEHTIMPGFSIDTVIVLFSAFLSGLVFLGQRRTSIRESIEQLDDRNLSTHNYKLKPILHNVEFYKLKTTISFRSTNIAEIANLSKPKDITQISENLVEEIRSIDGVKSAKVVESEEIAQRGDGKDVTEFQSELHITCRSVNAVTCRRIADQVLSKLRALDRR